MISKETGIGGVIPGTVTDATLVVFFGNRKGKGTWKVRKLAAEVIDIAVAGSGNAVQKLE